MVLSNVALINELCQQIGAVKHKPHLFRWFSTVAYDSVNVNKSVIVDCLARAAEIEVLPIQAVRLIPSLLNEMALQIFGAFECETRM